MTQTQPKDKVRSLFLAALMVFSVLGGTMAFAGTAAAANDPTNLQFSANSGASSVSIAEEESTTTDITFEVDNLNDANSGQTVNFVVSAEDGVEFSGLNSVNANGGSPSVSSSANVNSDGDIEFAVSPSNQSANANYTLDGAVLDAPTVSADTPYNLTVEVNDTGGADANTTFQDSITVLNNAGTFQTGFLSGRVSDQNNDDVPFANVTATRDSDGLTRTTQTNNVGEYTLEVPEGNYTITVDRDGFSTATSRSKEVTQDQTTSANLVIRQLINPDNIEIVSQDAVALADGQDRAEFTVRVTTNDTANTTALANTPVTVTVTSNDSAYTFTSAQTITTDSNGEATFNLTSNAVQDVGLQFEATEGDSVTTNATASFIPESGEGVFVAQVKDVDTAAELTNATVWAVEESRFSNNDISFAVGSGVNASDEALFRVVNNETGEVLDSSEYDITYNDSSDFVRVDELNESDLGVGSGFLGIAGPGTAAVNTSGGFEFTVTPLEPGDYVVQRTDVGVTENASNDDFSNVTTATVSEDLTASGTAARAETTDANPVATTNENGQATLTNLFANGKVGVDYVVMAERADYKPQYQDVNITSYDTTRQYTERTFLLEQREIEPDSVDITQVGTHPALAQTEGGAPNPELITPFGNQTDAFYQEVPRDGTVDVIEVSSTATNFQGDATPVDANVTVELNETFDGQFLGTVIGGEVVSNDVENTTITVSTGEDGTATVLLETEQNAETLSVKKTATIESDSSVTDSSNTTFVGTIVVQEAEVSGIVTNENNEPVPSNVYLDEIELEGVTFDIEPIAFGESDGERVIRTFEITRTDTNQSATFNASYDSTPGDYDFSDFPGVSVASGENLTLATLSTGGVSESSSYTLPRIPSIDQDASLDSTVVVSAASDLSVSEAAAISDLRLGTAVSTVTEPGRTSTANVEVSGAVGGPFGVDNVTVTPANATQGDTVTVTAEITNQGGVSAETTYTVTVNGSTMTETTEVIVAGGTTTISMDIDTSDLESGSYDVRVDSGDDFGTATLTVDEETDGSGGFTDVLNTIEQFNNGNAGFQDVLDAIESFNSGN